MRYESAETARGNVGVSYESQAIADEQAKQMDEFDCHGCRDCNGCRGCRDCHGCRGCIGCRDCNGCRGCIGCRDCNGCRGCSDCRGCRGCIGCSDCRGCRGCRDCRGCRGCIGFAAQKDNLISTTEQSITNLDQVREVILTNQDRLEMGGWHGSSEWQSKTREQEAACGTTHCLAGWLHVFATNPAVRAMDAQDAGFRQAPIACGMFFQTNERVLEWLTNREYAD